METTALVVSALAAWRKAGHPEPAVASLIDRGALFLLKSADGRGGWSTGQATVRALTAILDIWGKDPLGGSMPEVWVNGQRAGKVSVPGGRTVHGPITIDVSSLVKPGMTNEVSVTGTDSRALQAQLNTTWYEKWGQPHSAKDLVLAVQYSKTTAAVNDAVSCDVLVSRPSFRGYGMVIAEIGLPPGTEVDRGALTSIVDDSKSGVNSFEVAPDHVTFYIWPRAADSGFRFVFRPRFAMTARTAPSVLYDYYNPDESLAVPPQMFTVAQ